MKNQITFFLAAVLGCLVLFSSCTKKSDSSPSYTMKATVGSSAFSASNCWAITASSGGTSITTIYGSNGSSGSLVYPNMALYIVNWNGNTGSFTLDSTMSTAYAEYINSSTLTDYSLSKSGTINITAVSSTSITGNFNFVGNDGKNITGGTFTAKKP